MAIMHELRIFDTRHLDQKEPPYVVAHVGSEAECKAMGKALPVPIMWGVERVPHNGRIPADPFVI